MNNERGFTLVEMLIVIAITPLVVGSLAFGLITTLQNRDTTTQRISDSHDAQILSTYFTRDVNSASSLSTSTQAICGNNAQLVGLSWKPDGASTSVAVTYGVDRTTGQLNRYYCASGASSTATASATLVHDASLTSALGCNSQDSSAVNCVEPVQPSVGKVALSVDCVAGNTCTGPSVDTATVKDVVFAVVENDPSRATPTPFKFQITASPQGYQAGSNTHAPPLTPPVDLVGTNPQLTFTGQSDCRVTINGEIAIANDGSSVPPVSPLNAATGSNPNFTYTDLETPDTNLTGDNIIVGPSLSDPYLGALTAPKPSDPNVTTVSGSSLPTATTAGADHLSGGIYYVTGDVTVKTTVVADGPTLLYIAASGSLSVSGQGSLTLGQSLYAYSPVVLWNASSSSLDFGGNGSGAVIGGTIYSPNGSVQLDGTGSGGGLQATSIIAQKIGCAGGGTKVGGLTAGPVATTTDVSTSANPSQDAKPVTLTAVVTPATGSLDGGQVVFTMTDANNQTTTVCQVAAVAQSDGTGEASCDTAPLTAGASPYSVHAAYQGDAAFSGSAGDLSPVQKVKYGTTTTVTNTSQSLQSGQTANLSVQVAGIGSGPVPTGTVHVVLTGSDGTTTVLCTAGATDPTLLNGSATCQTGTLLAGLSQYSAVATYSGDSSNLGSVSPAQSITVGKTPTSTAVTSSQNPSAPGTSVKFFATISPTPDAGTNVTFGFTNSDNSSFGAAVCNEGANNTVLVSSGVATCTIPKNTFVDGKTYTVAAKFLGDSSYAASQGVLANGQQVASKKSQTTSALTITPANGQTSTYKDTATVTDPNSASVTMQGTVAFYLCKTAGSSCQIGQNGIQTLGSAQTLSGGSASVSQASNNGNNATIKIGQHYCMAAYYSDPSGAYTGSDDGGTKCFTA